MDGLTRLIGWLALLAELDCCLPEMRKICLTTINSPKDLETISLCGVDSDGRSFSHEVNASAVLTDAKGSGAQAGELVVFQLAKQWW